MKLFIDTNILLHFNSLDKVDWLEVCGSKKIEVLFAPIVIEELDKQKRNNNSKISKRAKEVIRKIHNIGNKGNWSDNVYIEIILKRTPDKIFFDNDLDKEVHDDRLLASLIHYKNTVEKDVKLLTNDLGPKLKCQWLSIECLSLPEQYELNNEDEDIIKENKSLKDQINKIKLSIPKLKLLFDDDKEFTTIRIKKFDFDVFYEKEMESIHSKYKLYDLSNNKSNLYFGPLINYESLLNYNIELLSFFDKYGDYLVESENYFRSLFLTNSLKFKLFNEGSIPATDIDVKLHFPDGFDLSSRLIKNNQKEPIPPSKPGELLSNVNLASQLSQIITKPNVTSRKGFPSINKTNSYDVTFTLETLKHNQDYVFNSIYLTFDSFEGSKGFTIDYKIYAANIPDVIHGQLNVRIENE